MQWQCTSHSGAQKVIASAVVIFALFHITNILQFAELTDFLQHLDARANAAIRDSKKFAAERKGRAVATPLESLPPTGAPSWTVKKDWMKGIINIKVSFISSCCTCTIIIGFEKCYRSSQYC